VDDASRLVNSILDSRDKCILLLLFKTGMRVGELISLDMSDVDLDKGEVTLKLKKKRSNRVLFLDNEAITVLQRWLAARKNPKGSENQALFLSKIGTRITKRSTEEIIEKHAERVGLHDLQADRLEDRFTPHCCRHWFITHLLAHQLPSGENQLSVVLFCKYHYRSCLWKFSKIRFGIIQIN
jgi:integrase